jgi:hypothetical protein
LHIEILNYLGRLSCSPKEILATFTFIIDDVIPYETENSVRNRIMGAGRY